MTGPHDSVIGVRHPLAIQRFLTQVHVKFKPAEDNPKFCGALIDVDPSTGRASAIERLQIDAEFDSSQGDSEGE
jgi:calcineurin-like phosphoesterase